MCHPTGDLIQVNYYTKAKKMNRLDSFHVEIPEYAYSSIVILEYFKKKKRNLRIISKKIGIYFFKKNSTVELKK